VTPYWSDGQVTLYLGDCREVTEWLAADVLVTDPPYGRGWGQHGDFTRNPGGAGGSTKGNKGIRGDENTSVRDAALSSWGDRPAAIFGDLMLPPPAGNKLTMIYQKPPDAGKFGAVGGYRRDAEAIYLVGRWPTGIGGRSSVLAATRGHGHMIRRAGHPHAKPVDVMETLIAACPPGVIADPFAGAGSTLVAARNLGRCAIGVELDERYAERAARRLDQGVLELA